MALKRAVIISAGTISDYEFTKALIRDDDFIICADGGLNHALKMGVTPNLIVGDFDSFKGELPEGENVVSLPCEKDYTDTHTAVFEAKKRGAAEILLLGTSGTRLDHTIANIALLETMRRMGIRGKMIDKNNCLFLAEKHEIITGMPGTTVSLLPLLPVKGITMKGFKWSLKNADIELFNPIWVSNELTEEQAEISFDSGVLLVDLAND